MFDLRKTRGWSKIDYLPSFLNTSEIDHCFSEKRRKNVKQQNVRGLKNEELKLYNHTIYRTGLIFNSRTIYIIEYLSIITPRQLYLQRYNGNLKPALLSAFPR